MSDGDVIDFSELEIGDIVVTSYHPVGGENFNSSLEECVIVGKSPREDTVIIYNEEWDHRGRGHGAVGYSWYKSKSWSGHWVVNEGSMRRKGGTFIKAKQVSLIEIDKDYADLFV
jgi:hypothetical protein